MAQIKSKNSKPEIAVRKICHRLGLRFRLHKKIGNTKPDLVFKKYNTVIFVNGCFWHKHDCKYGKVTPKTNSIFWENKRNSTVQRDSKNYTNLDALNWQYLIIWECQLKDSKTTSILIKNHFNLN